MGFAEFYRDRFLVTPDVLIPRPETEYLVDLLVNELKGKKKRILDVGVGSGAILLSLLKAGVAPSGTGVDVSNQALNVCSINAHRFRLNPTLIISDRLSQVNGPFDLIVSNPPYIKASSHKQLVQESVDRFEPQVALYLEDSVYEDWFLELFSGVKSHLQGHFFMEGHELEVSSQAAMLTQLGFQHVSILQDQYGRERFLRAEA
jgi:release factor glutamine methyltransferase